jgi:hypothetical protein
MLCEKNLDCYVEEKMFSAFNNIEDKETEESNKRDR